MASRLRRTTRSLLIGRRRAPHIGEVPPDPHPGRRTVWRRRSAGHQLLESGCCVDIQIVGQDISNNIFQNLPE
jgi:hypothetical protein